MTTAKWANIGDDAGALHALLERIPSHVPVDIIDYVWIFPPRSIAIGESIVVVVGAFNEDRAKRRVFTAHFTVSRSKKGEPFVNLRFDEHGSAPTDAVPRIVSGVLRRLGEDTDASPREEAIGGSAEKWDALIVELGGHAEGSVITQSRGDAEGDHTQSRGEAEGDHTQSRGDAEDVDGGSPGSSESDAPESKAREPTTRT